jgi:hypothetical protein
MILVAIRDRIRGARKIDRRVDLKPFAPRRIEVITGAETRRRRSEVTKAAIVAEGYAVSAVVAQVARRHVSGHNSYLTGGGSCGRMRIICRCIGKARSWRGKAFISIAPHLLSRVGFAALELEPLHAHLVQILKSSTKLFADEVCCPVLDRAAARRRSAISGPLPVTTGREAAPIHRKRVSAPTFRRGSGHGVMPAHERSF